MAKINLDLEDEIELDNIEDIEATVVAAYLEDDDIPIVKKKREKKKETDIYVKPEEMWEEIRNYYLALGDNYDWKIQKIVDKTKDYPAFPYKLATMINDIADRMAYLPNFVRYSWKAEMIGDAILKMVKAVRDCSFKGYSTDKIIKKDESNGIQYFYHFDRRQKIRKKKIQEGAVFEMRADGEYITYKSDAFNYFTGISANSFINRIKKENLAKQTIDAYQEEVWEATLSTENYTNVRRPKVFSDSDHDEVVYEN